MGGEAEGIALGDGEGAGCEDVGGGPGDFVGLGFVAGLEGDVEVGGFAGIEGEAGEEAFVDCGLRGKRGGFRAGEVVAQFQRCGEGGDAFDVGG